MLLLLLACTSPEGDPPGKDPPPDSAGDTAERVPDDTGADTDPGPDEATGEVLITEVMSANGGSVEDGHGHSPDWIELYNPGPTAVDLDGWGLSDTPGEPFRWVFPAVTLLPGEYRVVFASAEGAGAPEGELHASFRLDAAGEALTLTRPDGGLADAVEVPALPEDRSWGRAQVVTERRLVGPGDPARFAVAPGDGWTAPTFDDADWDEVVLGVGFDGGVASGPPENAALERPTTQSSDGYGFTGVQAVDGEPGTFSHTGDADLAPWWQVDLEGPWSVSAVTLLNRADCCPERLYNLTVSLLDADGGVAWASEVLNPVSEGTAPTSPGSRLDVTPDAPVLAWGARVDKVAVNGASSSEWLSMAEVVVTGSPASPYADTLATDVGAVMAGVAASAGVRVGVGVEPPPSRATLTVRVDDGFAAWIDGEAVASHHHGAGRATAAQDGTEALVFPIDPTRLGPAATLAIEVQNVAVDDDDLLLSPELVAAWIETGDPAFFDVPTPGAPNGAGHAGYLDLPTVDPPRGFYDAPQAVTLTAPTPGATLVYTLDGTRPTAEWGTRVEPAGPDAVASVTLEVPTTTNLRVAAIRDGWVDSRVATHTYLFLDDVVRQPEAPPGVPAVWQSRSEGAWAADYAMDPEVVDDPRTHADLMDGLRAIPTLSVVTDPDDLWGEDGIYVNSAERGDAWERAASVELILPDGSTGFQEDCGIQIHGWGWRYHSSTLKHSFRLEFSPTYGASKLEWPLFADAPVDRFDSIVLRAGGSKTWLDFRDPAQAQYLHDAFARDTARDMGKVDGHATFVHLYLNGLYWGLYDPVERPDAGFGEEYFGGDDADYDAINRRTTTNEAIDGDLEAYDTLLALADADLSDPEAYAAVEAMLDLDDLIDYMLIHQYTVNRDGPCCFESNNMRGIRKREEGAQFRFFVWDMEYSLWEATDDTNVNVDVAGAIAHVYARLRDNASFRARYAARARAHLTGDGALTPEAASARYAARAAEIEDALVAESARWGDTYREPPYTRDVEWLTEYTRLQEEFFPYRTELLIEQLTAVGLYEP